MLLLIDLTSYTTNMENKILKNDYIYERLNAKIRLSVKMVVKPVIYIKTNYLLQTNFAYKK